MGLLVGSHPLGDTHAKGMMLIKSLRKCHFLRNLQQAVHESPSLIKSNSDPSSLVWYSEAGCDATVSDHRSYIDQLNEKLRERMSNTLPKGTTTKRGRHINVNKFLP